MLPSAEQYREPSVFQYDDFRLFLNDYYLFQKQNEASFSFRKFSQRIGYRSPSILKVVMQGRRNLSEKAAKQFAKGLLLSEAESEFFRNLVAFNQARTGEEKQSCAQALLRSKVYARLRPLAKVKFEYWSRWYNVAIRELVGLKGFREDADWIASVMKPRITPENVRESIAQLLDLGLLKRDENGFLIQAQTEVTSGDSVINAALAQFHREMLQRAREALDRFGKPERQISAVTVSLSKQGEEQLRAMIHGFRKEVLALVENDENHERVFQVNFQLFPLTEVIKP